VCCFHWLYCCCVLLLLPKRLLYYGCCCTAAAAAAAAAALLLLLLLLCCCCAAGCRASPGLAPPEQLVPVDNVLQHLVQRVANVQVTVGVRRTVMQRERLLRK
jgi:hypothetical protein